MDLRHSPAVQPLSSASGSAESRSGRIGPISLGMKQMGERSAGNPHAIVRRGGAWKRGMVEIVGHSQTKERANGEPEHRPKPARQASTLLSGGRRRALQWAPPPTRQTPSSSFCWDGSGAKMALGLPKVLAMTGGKARARLRPWQSS